MPLSTLKKRSDFLNASAKGKKFATQTFTMLAAENGLSSSRLGYTVSKKVSKLAVERNKIKRRLKAAVAATFTAAKPGYDYVIIGKKTAMTREFEQLKGDLEFALKKIKL